MTTGSILGSFFPLSGGPPYIGLDDIAWSPDGKELSAFTSAGIYIWDAQSGALIDNLSNSFLFNNLNSVREIWQPQGHLLAAIVCQDPACQTTTVSIWDTSTWNVVQQYPHAYTFDWSPNGSQLALVNAARTQVLIVDALTGQQVQQVTVSLSQTIAAVHWAPDGKRLALETTTNATSNAISTSIWNIANGQQLYAFPRSNCFEARWSPNGRYLSCTQSEKSSNGYTKRILIWVA